MTVFDINLFFSNIFFDSGNESLVSNSHGGNYQLQGKVCIVMSDNVKD